MSNSLILQHGQTDTRRGVERWGEEARCGRRHAPGGEEIKRKEKRKNGEISEEEKRRKKKQKKHILDISP